MCKRQRLPKLRENNKLMCLKNEMNRIIAEILEQNEINITDINHLI